MLDAVKTIAEKHSLNPDRFLAALEEAFKIGLIARTYDLPDQTIDVDAYRALFSKDGKGNVGLKPQGLGDRAYISKKLKKWFAMNPEYSMEDVLNATRHYVRGVLEKGEALFLVRADYFIEKHGMSQLTSTVEEYLALKLENPHQIDDGPLWENWTQEAV